MNSSAQLNLARFVLVSCSALTMLPVYAEVVCRSPAVAHLHGVIGTGYKFVSRDGSTDVFTQNLSPPYVVKRVPVPSAGQLVETLRNEFGITFPARGIAISANAGLLAIEASDASGFDADDDNGFKDIYVVRWAPRSFERITLTADGLDSNGDSHSQVVSPDGTSVAFVSRATNLVVSAPTTGLYLWSAVEQSLRPVAHQGLTTLCPDLDAFSPIRFSEDGDRLLFHCVGGLGSPRLFEVQVDSAVATEIALPSPRPSVSGADRSLNRLLLTGFLLGAASEQPFILDRATQTLVSVSERDVLGFPDKSSNYSQISDDGRFVLFATRATNQIGTENGSFLRTYIRDVQSNELSVVNGDGHGVPRADVSGTLVADGSALRVKTTWAQFSPEDELQVNEFRTDNPLLCRDDRVLDDGFER